MFKNKAYIAEMDRCFFLLKSVTSFEKKTPGKKENLADMRMTSHVCH